MWLVLFKQSNRECRKNKQQINSQLSMYATLIECSLTNYYHLYLLLTHKLIANLYKLTNFQTLFIKKHIFGFM